MPPLSLMAESSVMSVNVNSPIMEVKHSSSKKHQQENDDLYCPVLLSRLKDDLVDDVLLGLSASR